MKPAVHRRGPERVTGPRVRCQVCPTDIAWDNWPHSVSQIRADMAAHVRAAHPTRRQVRT